MSSARQLFLGVLLGLCGAICWSCAPQLPADYVAHADAARAATARRDHIGAAQAWAEAAKVAELETDRQEAVYRQATSAQRAGRAEEARTLLQQLATTPGPRQERAAYDLALSALDRDPKNGREHVRLLLSKFPASGLARGALDRLLATLSVEERIATLQSLAASVRDPNLRERVLFLLAQNQEAHGDPRAASSTYGQLLEEYPYPLGRYWDEATLRQAMIHLASEQAPQAIALLEQMLSKREQSAIVGSYERRYADATLLLAYALLDADWHRARELLRKFLVEDPSSRHRDDAAWVVALLSRDRDDAKVACMDAKALKALLPDSRYAECLGLVCTELASSEQCRPYIETERNTPRASLEVVLKLTR